MDITLLDFILLSLSTWRLSSLFADEEGPFGVFERLRTRLGVRYISSDNGSIERCVSDSIPILKRTLARGILCKWCNSVWFGTLLTILYIIPNNAIHNTVVVLALPLALSAGAILVDSTMG